ncbi:MAG: ketol-acid reductoisomerase [Chloroflexi bacterium]|nr:MAG: ketol-acid reductoisomerase [Chloroflexota bacterium]
MTIIYQEDDGDLGYLTGKTIGIIGYGNLGRPLALNLRDSGIRPIIGVRDAERGAQARADGLRTGDIDAITKESDIIMMMIPDEAMPQVYLDHVAPSLKRGDMLVFSSGYNIAFGFIEVPPFVDVGLIAPRTLGASVRERYLDERGFYSFVSVGQDVSGIAWPTLLALAKAVGALKAGAVEVSIEQEAELDLFIQQAILPMLHLVITTAANLLLNLGYPPEAAFLDLYISGELRDYLDKAGEDGLMSALRLSSLTGQYGVLSRLARFKDLKLERLMEMTLEEIRNGEFSKEWSKEYADGYRRLQNLLKEQEQLDIWEMEQQTLDMLKGRLFF